LKRKNTSFGEESKATQKEGISSFCFPLLFSYEDEFHPN
jgi:hypothetical protein